jgi:hypothetical protein
LFCNCFIGRLNSVFSAGKSRVAYNLKISKSYKTSAKKSYKKEERMIQVRVRGPKETVTVSIELSSTFQELKELIQEKLHLDKDFELMGGFPPKAMALQDDDILQGHLNQNDSLRVQFIEFAGQQAVGISKKSKSTAKKPSIAQTPSKPVFVPFGGRVASLNPPPRPPKRKSTSANAAPRRTRLSASDSASSEADISEHLLSAVSGGTGKRNKILRKVFRDAVEHQYNSAKAVSRLQAVYSGKYTIKDNSASRYLGTGNSSRIDIRFHRGFGSRTYFEETVDLLSDEVLKELMKVALNDDEEGSGMGREVLKPMNLSKCSPRIFWSLVYHHGPNLIEAIKELLKGIDDNCEEWLLDRKRELSEKARENQRQKETEEQEKQARKRRKLGGNMNQTEGTTDEPEVIDMIDDESVPAAVEVVVSPLKRRLLTFLSKIPFENNFPEAYERTLFQFFQSTSTNSSSATSSSSSSSSGSDCPSSALIQLANHRITRESLQHLNSSSTTSSKGSQTIYEEQLESWISLAQHRLFSVFWNQICGGGSERTRKALEKLRIRVPSELKIWKSAPEGLLKGLLAIDPILDEISFYWNESLEISNTSSSSSSNETKKTLTKEIIAKLISLCEKFEESFPWMKTLSGVILEDLQNEEQEETTEENETNNWEEDWQFHKKTDRFIGQKCRVVIRSEDDEEEEEDESGAKKKTTASSSSFADPMEENLFVRCGYWEDGTCVAVLPATEEEPMALWRVRLDETPKIKTKNQSNATESDLKEGKFEDMEEHEITTAIKLCSKTNN